MKKESEDRSKMQDKELLYKIVMIKFSIFTSSDPA